MPRVTPANRRSRILAAARGEFASRGFAPARMEDIALAVGVSKAALYLQFADKEALFRAMVEALVSETLPRMLPEALLALPPARALERAVHGMMARMTVGDLAFVPRLIIGEGGNFPELVRFYHDHVISRSVGIIEGLIARGVAQGDFRPVDPGLAARSLIGGILIAAIWQTVLVPAGVAAIDVDAMARTHADVLLHGLVARGEPV